MANSYQSYIPDRQTFVAEVLRDQRSEGEMTQNTVPHTGSDLQGSHKPDQEQMKKRGITFMAGSVLKLGKCKASSCSVCIKGLITPRTIKTQQLIITMH